MTKKWLLMSLILCLAPLMAHADGDSIHPRLLRLAKSVLTYIDTLAVSGIDRRYISVPEKPWQVIVKGNINSASLSLKSTVEGDKFFGLYGSCICEPYIKSGIDSYLGLWVGYRGYGIGYSHSVSGEGNGSLFTIGMTGSRYGFNLRRHSFETDDFETRYQLNYLDAVLDTTMTHNVVKPLRVKSLIVDGYYFFNSKRFSYSAAYDQSVYQLRSSGSFIVGGMYYYSNINYAMPENSSLIFFMDDVGQVKQWQASLGAGYAYNYVPAKGVLVSAMFMPMLTFYNRIRYYRFNSVVKQLMDSEVTIEEAMKISKGREMWPDEEHYKTTHTSHMLLNFNARLSFTWNIGERAYFNAYGQLYNFRFTYDHNHGALTEWFVNAALGFRF